MWIGIDIEHGEALAFRLLVSDRPNVMLFFRNSDARPVNETALDRHGRCDSSVSVAS